MKALALIVSFVLSLSLLVQNTCPHGYAGKTSVARSCGHCPYTLGGVEATDAAKLVPTVKKQFPPLPLFVLSLQERTLTLEPAPVETAPLSLADRYRDAEPYELLRPPHA